MSDALLGYNSEFQIESAITVGLFTALAEVFRITPPSLTVDQIDVTHMKSPNRMKEFIDGMIDPGSCEVEMNYVPGSPSDVILIDILKTPPGTVRTRNCRVVYPNGAYDTFNANLESYVPPAITTEAKMSAVATWRVTGNITRTAAP